MIKGTIINIGDELLAGKTVNTNASFIASQLNDIGVDVVKIETISDTFSSIYNSIHQCLSLADIVIVTGGLGPTHDDITKVVLANYFNQELILDKEIYTRIKNLFLSKNKEQSISIKNQSMIPKGAKALNNDVGTAPGMMLTKDNKLLFSLPGVPSEMKFLITNEVIPIIENKFDLNRKNQLTIKTSCVSETVLESILKDNIQALPADTKLAFLPSLGEVKVRISQVASLENTKEKFDLICSKIISKINQYIYTLGDETIEESLGQLLLNKGKKIMTAESCTGGYLAQRIISTPGASAYFTGGLIPYQNDLKEKWLNVKPDTLLNYGAVSEEVVLEMLESTLNHSHVDIGVAISGIAGPSGGSDEKPVGTVWVAWGDSKKRHSKKLQLWKHRKKNIHYTSIFCLNMLIKFLKTF